MWCIALESQDWQTRLMRPEPEFDFSDEPVDGSVEAPDRLDRTRFVSTLARSVSSLAGQRNSSVIGLVGPWGSGKTSIIGLVKSRLKHMSSSEGSIPWVAVDFNPWYFQDMASLQWGFLRALTDGIDPGKKRSRKVRDAVGEFGLAIAPLGAVGGLAGFDLSKSLSAASNLISTHHGPDRQRSVLEKMLKDGSKPILIILDDLDRLSPDELLLVFKLIRLVGRLPFVHYLIAYDEDTLQDVLSRTGLVGGDKNRASSYMEKMIQLRIDVPPLRQTQIEDLVEDSLNRMASSVGLSMNRAQQEKFGTAYELHLRHALGTPRALKRYVAQVEAFFPAVAGEVDPSDFLLLTWLRTAAPQLYAVLPREKSMLTGSAGSMLVAFATRERSPSDYKEHWDEIFRSAHVAAEDLPSIKGILGFLFPRYEDIRKSSSSFRDVRSSRGVVSNSDYFDRFFAFEVPLEDISDDLADKAYVAITTGQSNEERAQLEAQILVRASLVIRKLEDRFDASKNPGEAYLLLIWLAEIYSAIPDLSELFSPRRQVEGFCMRIYTQLDPESDAPTQAIKSISEMAGSISLAASLVRSASSSRLYDAAADIAARESANALARLQFGEIIAANFQQYLAGSPHEIPDDVWNLIWTWKEVDLRSARRTFAAQFESKKWRRLDVAVRLVTSSITLGVADAVPRISEFELDLADQLIGLQQLIDECRLMPDFTSVQRVGQRETATLENRTGFIFGIIDDLCLGRRDFPPTLAEPDG